jgi:hypothetical protein
MAVAQIFVLRPRPGRLQDFMKHVARVDRIVSRNGGKMRVWNTESGGEPGTVGVVVETTDWRAFGEYNAKMEADPEWRAFLSEISSQRDPAADMVRTQISVELPVG